MTDGRGQNMNNKLQLTSYESQVTSHGSRKNAASALIIAVILTSLLAIIGVMFVMIARVDKMATSAISENKELNSAVETVVAKISQELVLDVPGVAGAEYYDYPDACNVWLANLEPYNDGGTYKWRQISDIYKKLGSNLELPAEIIPDYNDSVDVNIPADADGDGVADSKWVKLADITSNKGKSIYAAVRVVDNGAMLNVNTARQFNPSGAEKDVNGSSQTQINLFGLAQRSPSNTIGQLDNERYGSEPHNLDDYIRNVVWRYNKPNGLYTPFDISDELEIRNRFTLNRTDVDSRLENLWADAFKGAGYLSTPVVTAGDYSNWLEEVYWSEPTAYSYRHIGSIYNMDRIITPDCNTMTNINIADVAADVNAIRKGLLDANYPSSDVNAVAAQIAVDINDYRDSDSDVTVYLSPYDDGKTYYYGFEQPCIYISELAHRAQLKSSPGSPPTFPVDYDISYAIELYKPYSGDSDPVNWQLVVGGTPIQITNWTGNEQFCVIKNENPLVTPFVIDTGAAKQDASAPPTLTFTDNTLIELQRPLPGGGYITVDAHEVPGGWWNMINDTPRSIQRDTAPHKCIRRLWADSTQWRPTDDLGTLNNDYSSPDTSVIQAHPANAPFTNIGEIGMLFRKPAYYESIQPIPTSGVIGYGSDSNTEEKVRLNLADPNFQQLFKYLTVFDPNADGIDNDGDGTADNGELKVPGRININTAPWFVLAQLPWVSQRTGGYNDANLARAIVAYRDKLDLRPAGPDYSGANGRETRTGITGLREAPGFNSIGELAAVINNSNKDNYSMNYYTLGTEIGDLPGFPDLTTPDHPPIGAPLPDDGAADDFEERDVIFARISNLVTVRSDVFTVYILVRIGTDGPQKRVMAILDRSNVRKNPDYDPAVPNSIPYLGKVRIIALHPVPDPR
jgi:hypothetical protein